MKRNEPGSVVGHSANGQRNRNIQRDINNDDQNGRPPAKIRRITRSQTRAVKAAMKTDLFERIVGPVISSCYLRWYDVVRLGKVSRGCRDAWNEERENYDGWKILLKELNQSNCTNRCSNCEQMVLLKSNRACCTRQQWDDHSAKRTADFHGIIDLLMSSGFLNWRERGGVRKISKTTYKVHKEYCTCSTLPDERTSLLQPFLPYDPRYKSGYDDLSVFRKCQQLVTYTSWMIQNLHSFYAFDRVTDPNHLPESLEQQRWIDIQIVTLQRGCPHRYSFVMNMVSLFLAQGELQRSPPYWYSSGFLGRVNYGPPADGTTYFECLGSGISEFCLPATDEVLCTFLRTKCYPSLESQDILGPLVKPLCLFSPFFEMVPPDSATSSVNSNNDEIRARVRMPEGLEVLNDEMIDNMSLHFFCTIS